MLRPTGLFLMKRERLASVAEIRNKENNLNAPLYIRGNQDTARPERGAVSQQQDIADWQQSSLVLRDSMDEPLGKFSYFTK